MSLGIYISVPFCRTKCSYCNFASDVFSKSAYESYVGRLLQDIAGAEAQARELKCNFEDTVDSIYLGGGTPSILDPSQLVRIFAKVRQHFHLTPDAEVTVECAPGSFTPALIDTLLQIGVNRVSLGVQSFVDQEAQSVGRLHKRSTVLDDIAHLRAAGVSNINVDIIAGLPFQTPESWQFSVAEAIATQVPHISVYMLEIDDESRLGRELLAGGSRYHAHFVPDEDRTADFYQQACTALQEAGIEQYEISNFARTNSQSGKPRKNESQHNLKYWTREPYFGFGVDAHSMLRTTDREDELDTSPANVSVRFSAPDSLDGYLKNHASGSVTQISRHAAIEENFFLGLRLNRGVHLTALAAAFTASGSGGDPLASWRPALQQCVQDGLMEQEGSIVRLSDRGRLLSNEVFARFVLDPQAENSHEADPQKAEFQKIKVESGHVQAR